jgi:hypothetical protein
MKDALCRAFCRGLVVREVPVGLAVGTPFRRRDGDRVAFFVVYDKRNPGFARLEDDGLVIPEIEASGIDLLTGRHAFAFQAMLFDAGVHFDADQGVLHTKYMPVDQIPEFSLSFISVLMRVQDLVPPARERSEETFREIVTQAVTGRFADRAIIRVRTPVYPEIWQTPADIVVAPKILQPLALFLGTSTDRTLEATVAQLKSKSGDVPPFKVMLVLPTESPSRVKVRTRALAGHEVPSVVFPGHEEEALDIMETMLFGQVRRPPNGGAGSSPIH